VHFWKGVLVLVTSQSAQNCTKRLLSVRLQG
jgi:hypothetical protein